VNSVKPNWQQRRARLHNTPLKSAENNTSFAANSALNDTNKRKVQARKLKNADP